MNRIIILFFVLIAVKATAQETLVEAATGFINLLDPAQKEKALYPLTDEERFNWHYIPRERKGITFHDFSVAQRSAALTLLRLSLSEYGYKKATGIMQLEVVLKALEGLPPESTYRDPLNYALTIFGTPSKTSPWGWRIEGHHISLNYTSTNGLIESASPGFLGTNPAIVPEGPQKGTMVLKEEMEYGFRLLNSLNADQLKTARFSERAPNDMFTANRRKATHLTPEGLKYTDLNSQQKELFMQLLKLYVDRYPFDFSNRFMEKIEKAGIENLSFAWAGSLEPGQGHYYRIQGPMLLIEYDNTQNNANHIHSVIRDLTNDFGEDILREHYEKEHKN